MGKLEGDTKINLAPDLTVDLRPFVAAAGPGSPGNGSGSNNSAGGTTSQPRRRNLRPIRGHIVMLGVGRNTMKRSNIHLRSPKVSPVGAQPRPRRG